MSKQYRIVPPAALPSDADIARYRDFGKLVYNYERMTRPLYKRPLYKDPKAFIAIVIIVLLTILVVEVIEKEREAQPPVPKEQGMP